MIQTIINMFRIKELRQRLLFTLGLLAIYRIGCFVPTPGIDPALVKERFASTGGLMELMDLFTGGAMRNVTVFALGVMPYISASIIIQLLTSIVPTLEQLKKEGEQGRKVINQYTICWHCTHWAGCFWEWARRSGAGNCLRRSV